MDNNVVMTVLVLAAVFVAVCLLGFLFTRGQKKREKRSMTKIGEDIR